MIELIEKYGIYVYAVVILFGGIWGVNYFPLKWETKYRFGAFATVFAAIFVLLEVFVSKTFVAADVIKYLLTYTVVTSCYQMALKKLFEKWGLIDKEEKTP